MIERKEFYFVRHGQTDHNKYNLTTDCGDIPLNDTGREQALFIQPIVSTLPVKVLCHSPLKRAKETKEIISSNLQVDHLEIPHLTECNGKVWLEMTRLGKDAHLKAKGDVAAFIEQVRKGINQALENPGPVLIVAHGGVHWAMCCLMEVEHNWMIDNCLPVHFTIGKNGRWHAKKLI
ncbi:MAG TPA: histidine phosphatase family protein [Chlamydiales bacterium]|nr:histidine phosphatase family protein [Chlamydiales bacterium]